MNNVNRSLVHVVAGLAFLIFSAGATSPRWAHGSSARLNELSYLLGDMLERNRICFLDRALPILSTSFVNLDDLNESSPFGRLMGVMVASRFTQHGYRVVEVRLNKGNVIVQENNGELALSRELSKLEVSHEAQAIIVGTYSLAGSRLYINSRLVSLLDSAVLSSYDFSVRMTEDLRNLTQHSEGMGPLSRTSTKGSRDTTAPDGRTDSITDLDAGSTVAPVRQSRERSDPISSGSVLLQLSNPLAAKIVQTQLAKLGYYSANIDGIWRERSRAALAAFKRQNNLHGPTEWDMETQIALFNPGQ